MKNARWIDVEKKLPPKPGMYLVTVDTDDGAETMILHFDKKGHWIYEGEPTFCCSGYISVKLWKERPAPGEFEVD